MKKTIETQSWWQTIPGILTAVAAILSAATGLIVALNDSDPDVKIHKPGQIAIEQQTVEENLKSIEAKMSPTVAEQCERLAHWPNNQVTGDQVTSILSEFRFSVENTPGILSLKSATIADLYRCLGGARLIGQGELPEKISGALPLLRLSVRFNPSQALLEKNITTFDNFLKNKEGDSVVFFMTIYQVLRGGDAPDILELAKQTVEVLQK